MNSLNWGSNKQQTQIVKNQWKRQEGMTAIGLVLILAILAFFVLIILRLFPIYMEHFSVTTHLNQLASDNDTKNKTNAQIMDTLNKRFRIDDIKRVKPENIFIERNQGGSITIAIEYEVRTPAIGNVDMVVSFADEVNVN